MEKSKAIKRLVSARVGVGEYTTVLIALLSVTIKSQTKPNCTSVG